MWVSATSWWKWMIIFYQQLSKETKKNNILVEILFVNPSNLLPLR